jgi:GNAT superfamily N-acetyltransferase
MSDQRPTQTPFAGIDLARRLERAEAHANAKLVEARARVDPSIGAEWIEIAGAYAMFDGVGSPCTQTFGLGIFEMPAENDLATIEKFFEDHGAEVFHDVSPLAGIPLTQLLTARGYRPVEFSSVMVRTLNPESGSLRPPNPNVVVRPAGPDEADLWASTAAKGWSELPELKEFLLDLGKVSAQREDSVSLLAEIGGEPVATGVLCFHEGVALFAGAATIPEVRRQGAQQALLDDRLRRAAEKGCDIAMMCAEPGSASQRNAERHGFRIAYTRTKWGLIRQAGN